MESAATPTEPQPPVPTADDGSPWWRGLRRSVAPVLALLLLVGAWQALSDPVAPGVRELAAEMALHAPPVPAPADVERPPADLHWQVLDQRKLAGWSGPYWLRWQLETPASTRGEAFGLRLSLRAASRLWWNGQPLGNNGAVGRERDEEGAGRIDSVHGLPKGALTGKRSELLVLASSQHQGFRFLSADAHVEVAALARLHAGAVRPWLVVALALGMLALAWISLMRAQRGRHTGADTGLLLALGSVGLLLPLVEAWRPLLGYAYPLHALRAHLLLGLHLATALLLPAYLARRFQIAVSTPAWAAAAGGLLLLALLLPGFDSRGAALLLTALLASAALLLKAHGEPEERVPVLVLLLVGVLALLLDPGGFLDGPSVLLMAVLMAFLLLRHARRQQVIDRENAQLRAQRDRLALQLLRRGMQPHWLMNTLTSLQELIEQAPGRASRLVELLAEHFDRLRESSQHPHISLADELALCRSHLQTVSLALGQRIAIEVDADDLTLPLPPGVLHAQVENALTHAGAAACAARPFRLRVYREGQARVLELRAARGNAGHRGQGTGTRYIEASLAARPGGGRYAQCADGADWCGRIELACVS